MGVAGIAEGRCRRKAYHLAALSLALPLSHLVGGQQFRRTHHWARRLAKARELEALEVESAELAGEHAWLVAVSVPLPDRHRSPAEDGPLVLRAHSGGLAAVAQAVAKTVEHQRRSGQAAAVQVACEPPADLVRGITGAAGHV